MRRREPRTRAPRRSPVASTGSWATPSVRAKTLVDPPGRVASAVSLPARPLAASLRVPSPPRTTTTSTPTAAASWARRVAFPRRVGRREPVRPPSLHGFQHLLFRRLGPLGDLGDGGRAAEVLGQVADHLAQTEVELLDPPGYADGPALVAEVTLELADDRGGG